MLSIIFLCVSQAAVALKDTAWNDTYPMDFYSNQSLGPWTPNHPDNQPRRPARTSARVSVCVPYVQLCPVLLRFNSSKVVISHRGGECVV